jgi:hypothetical protein
MRPLLVVGLLLSCVAIVQAETPNKRAFREMMAARGVAQKGEDPTPAMQAAIKQRNADALAEARVRAAEYRANRGPLRSMAVTESTGRSTTRYGGGYGINGAGGYGGYLGYGNRVRMSPSMGLLTFPGNTMTTTSDGTTKSYEMTYPDLNDNGGGPVEVLNPFYQGHYQGR